MSIIFDLNIDCECPAFLLKGDSPIISDFFEKSCGDSQELNFHRQKAELALRTNNWAAFKENVESILEYLIENAPPVEKICLQELCQMLAPLNGEAFKDKLEKNLEAEAFYQDCMGKFQQGGFALSAEKCQKMFQAAIECLEAPCSKELSPTRFSWIKGEINKEWALIDKAAAKALHAVRHTYCGCHSVDKRGQDLPGLNLKLTPIDARADNVEEDDLQGKRFAVLGCDWGGGHRNAARGVGNIIAERMNGEVFTIDVPNHALPLGKDPIHNSVLRRLYGNVSGFCNEFAAHKAFALTNLIRDSGPSKPDAGDDLVPFIVRRLLETRPDFVVTTYNRHNESIITACEILGLPCLHVMTDIDHTIHTRDKPREYRHFKVGLTSDDAPNLERAHVTDEQRTVMGMPVRPQFYHPLENLQELAALKEKWGKQHGVDLSHKRILMLTGGENGIASPIPDLLAKTYKGKEPPFHVFVLCGRNEQSRAALAAKNLPFLTPLGMQNADQMRDLYALASGGGCVVAKAGGGTVGETLHMGVPILIDATPTPILGFGYKHALYGMANWIAEKMGAKRELPWEEVNGDYAIGKGMASRFTTGEEFLGQMDAWLKRDERPLVDRFKPVDFSKRLVQVVDQMLDDARRDPELRRRQKSLQLT